MVGRLRILAIALALGCLAAPTAGAAPFEGPGQTGWVRLGDGGASAPLAPHLPDADDPPTLARLEHIPADTCRLVLDINGTFGATHLAWVAGSDLAVVYADTGATDAPFRVHARWHLDLNDRCTAEATEAGTVWHDPRGRPFTAPRLVEPQMVLDPLVGSTVHVNVTITNDGTIPDNVTGRITSLREGWGGGAAGRVSSVPVPPLGNVTFPFRITVPADEPPRANVVYIAFTGTNGWADEAVVLLRLQPDPEAQEPRETDAAPDGATPETAPVPQWSPTAQAPGATALVVALALALVLWWARRRHG